MSTTPTAPAPLLAERLRSYKQSSVHPLDGDVREFNADLEEAARLAEQHEAAAVPVEGEEQRILHDLEQNYPKARGDIAAYLQAKRDITFLFAQLSSARAELAAVRQRVLDRINESPVHARADHSQNCFLCGLLKFIDAAKAGEATS